MSSTLSTSTSPSSRTVIDAKMSLSLWLRAGRAHKGLSLEDVAKITKIQPRILERLEAGKLEGLPAEVFVRGFVRSFARCVGLDEAEALERYTAAAGAPSAPTATARALVESMSELAPITATRSPKILGDVTLAAGSTQDLPVQRPVETVVEVFLPETGTLEVAPEPVAVIDETPAPIVDTIEVIEVASPIAIVDDAPVPAVEVIEVAEKPPAPTGKKKKGGKGRKRKQIASGTPSEPTPVVVETATASVDAEVIAEGSTSIAVVEATPVDELAPITETTLDVVAPAIEVVETTEPSEPWAPKMPTVVAPTVPWRRPFSATTTAPSALVPTLVIDDADPDSAEREQEDRAAAAAAEPQRRSFLPPILLDREDRSARQGGLTLAVIILLIAATLTLSYLMRRPSSTGDGVTQASGIVHDVLA